MTCALAPWSVAGSYFEACNCEAICPCRRVGDREGGRSTYGHCDFALSWLIERGSAAPGLDLGGRQVVLAGSYDDATKASPWRVVLYVDETADPAAQRALADIFLGRAGGTTLRNFARAIGEVHAVRPARIRLDHTAAAQSIEVPSAVRVRARAPVVSAEPVSCGIPGHDQPGQELLADVLAVDAGQLRWTVEGRCAFAATFAYRSD